MTYRGAVRTWLQLSWESYRLARRLLDGARPIANAMDASRRGETFVLAFQSGTVWSTTPNRQNVVHGHRVTPERRQSNIRRPAALGFVTLHKNAPPKRGHKSFIRRLRPQGNGGQAAHTDGVRGRWAQIDDATRPNGP